MILHHWAHWEWRVQIALIGFDDKQLKAINKWPSEPVGSRPPLGRAGAQRIEEEAQIWFKGPKE
jgi:hypothetical protein